MNVDEESVLKLSEVNGAELVSEAEELMWNVRADPLAVKSKPSVIAMV